MTNCKISYKRNNKEVIKKIKNNMIKENYKNILEREIIREIIRKVTENLGGK